MVVAAYLVHRRARGDGRVGASSTQFVSVPGDLDVAALDTRYGAGIANAIGGVGSHDWDHPPISAQIEYSAVGGRAPAHVVVARLAARF